MKKNDSSGLILVISAPSGAGKTTLCRMLAEKNPELFFSVSYTTRRPRGEEKNGRDYFFIKEEEFLKRRKEGFFAEWAKVHGAFYGTAKKSLDEAVEKGEDIVLTIDVEGAAQIKEKYPESVSVFIVSPTFEDLRVRLNKRKTENQKNIEERLRQAQREIELSASYNYRIVNRDLKDALGELEGKILKERLKLKRKE